MEMLESGMKKYGVFIDAYAYGSVEVYARSEEEAIELAKELDAKEVIKNLNGVEEIIIKDSEDNIRSNFFFNVRSTVIDLLSETRTPRFLMTWVPCLKPSLETSATVGAHTWVDFIGCFVFNMKQRVHKILVEDGRIAHDVVLDIDNFAPWEEKAEEILFSLGINKGNFKDYIAEATRTLSL